MINFKKILSILSYVSVLLIIGCYNITSFPNDEVLANLISQSYKVQPSPPNPLSHRRGGVDTTSSVGKFLYLSKDYNPISQSIKSPIQLQGSEVNFNGRTYKMSWIQWKNGNDLKIGINDVGLMQHFGFELLNNNNNINQQPIKGFVNNLNHEVILPAFFYEQYRYLDVTNLIKKLNWKLEVNNNVLKIISPPSKILNITQTEGLNNTRVVINLDRPTIWKVREENNQVIIDINGSYTPPDFQLSNLINIPISNNPFKIESREKQTFEESREKLEFGTDKYLMIDSKSNQQTLINLPLPLGMRSRSFISTNPPQLIIDISPDNFPAKDIIVTEGLHWKQQIITLENDKFPVTYLEIDLNKRKVQLKPIVSDNLMGINPLIKLAPSSKSYGAINGGFFNRNTQMPLGAIKKDGKWLSNPILNRGAIAWNNQGNFVFDRLTLQESLIFDGGMQLPIISLNSGYIQNGLSRYNSDWGKTYTPLTDNENIFIIQENKIIYQTVISDNQPTFDIPTNGYILVMRNNPQIANLLTMGSVLKIDSTTNPIDLNNYPHIIGAGPLLIKQGKIVLDGKLESFKDAFIKEKAIRSVIGITQDNKLIITAIHNRLGGEGATLEETAKIIQNMGAIEALNLDGGSSTSLYLGGELINRSPGSVSRIHNGIGIFIE